MIIDANEDAQARRHRFTVAHAAASWAFCATLARHYPEATADYGPPSVHEAVGRTFGEAMNTAALAWLVHAEPAEGFAPTMSGGVQMAQARTAAAAQRIAAHIASCGLTADQLYDITTQAVHDDIDRLLTDGDFAPISDDAARYALRNEADYRLGEAVEGGIPGLACLLYEVLGEPAAMATIKASIGENA